VLSPFTVNAERRLGPEILIALLAVALVLVV
jgi:hypothetical protein